MNRAKAIFAAGIIIVVAGASAALWYLNDNGMLGNEGTTVPYENNYEQQNNENDADKNDVNNNDFEENKDSENQNDENINTDNNSDKEVDKAEINDFLSVFSKVYFSEQRAFNVNSYNDYDLIHFAFLHIRNTDKSQISLTQQDDDIMYYNSVSYEKVNDVLKKYFNISVPAKSVYTENDYSFFRYSDGYFYTPAADGLAYVNTAVANSVENEGDYLLVKFTVYSGEEVYADGEAKIKTDNEELKLAYYNVYMN